MQKFSDFDICKEFKHKDKNKIIKYIEVMYSKDSQLNEIQNLQDRKIKACKLAKLDPDTKYVKEIMRLENEEVRNIIVSYLSFYQNNNEFVQLIVDQQLLWGIHEALLSPPSIDANTDFSEIYKKRGAMSTLSDEITRRVNRAYTSLYATEEIKEAAHQMVSQMKRPEQRVKERDDVQENS
jgi:hypothetical protein